MVTLRGGLARVPKAVAAKLKVRYQTTVSRICSNASDVTIEYTDRTTNEGRGTAPAGCKKPERPSQGEWNHSVAVERFVFCSRQ